MSTKNRFIVTAGLILAVVAFLAGYWPEYQRRTASDTANAQLRAQVEALAAQERLARVHGQLLDLIDAVAAMNYGEAQTHSSALFDTARQEASRTQNGDARAALEGLLAARDEVTALLAKADPAVLEPLRRSERQLRQVFADDDNSSARP